MEKEVERLTKLNAKLVAPPSKAHTLRAIIASALAKGKSEIENPLLARDQLETISAMEQLGAKISRKGSKLIVEGIPKIKTDKINVGSSGFLARAAIAICATADHEIIIDGSEQMRRRPVGELCNGLTKLGAEIVFLKDIGKLPLKIKGPLKVGKITLDGSESSQYVSALIMAAPMARGEIEIEVEKLVSAPYVNITTEVMEKFGIKIKKTENCWHIKPQLYKPANISIEGDYSAAAFFMEVAAITGGKIEISNLNPKTKQGDIAVLGIFEKMGCKISRNGKNVGITGPNQLNAIDLDMQQTPDLVPPVAVAAAFAEGKTVLRNLSHLRIKESDRLAALMDNLLKIGAKAEIIGNELHIEGSQNVDTATIDPKNDHRIAMAFAIAGLRIGIKVENAECVNKSFPDFWELIARLS
jgi:3-phosphoshikimate 1-carboxyvinyltransferase